MNTDGRDYYIDMLFFNIKLNCYVVVELKVRELKKEDVSQTKFYMKLVDEQIKESIHNKTLGIIISKEQTEFMVTYVKEENDIIPITYKIIKEGDKVNE